MGLTNHLLTGMILQVGGGFTYIFYVHPETWGNDEKFDEHIFQMGWFNHQLEFHLPLFGE